MRLPVVFRCDVDRPQVIDDLLEPAADLVDVEDPLEVEVQGATIAVAAADAEEALVDGFIPELEARPGTEVLAMLLAIGSVAQGRFGDAAVAAARRLVEAGVDRPGWAEELDQPVAVGDCWHLDDAAGIVSMLACSFHRAGRSHAVVITVDHLDCGAASDIQMLDADGLPEVLEAARKELKFTADVLDASEFRWRVEAALDARAVHDADSPADMAELEADEDGPSYDVLAALVRARMKALPMPSKPAPAHAEWDDGRPAVSSLQLSPQLAGATRGRRTGRRPPATRGRTMPTTMPLKRKKSDYPARIYRIMVRLRDAKPPIWRRIEVPADISLARLHAVIQIAFGWDDRSPARLRNPVRSVRDGRCRKRHPRRGAGDLGTSRARREQPAELPTTSATTGNTTLSWKRCSLATLRPRTRGALVDDGRRHRRIAAASGDTPSLWRASMTATTQNTVTSWNGWDWMTPPSSTRTDSMPRR
jgi:hypothetical protein